MLDDLEDTEGGWPAVALRERDGSNPIERKAVYRAQLEIKSMPASLVVQIALWPDKLADWAKETGIAPSVVYNMLARVKPYHRVRTLLARRLNVPKSVLDYLIDAPRPEPLAKLPPDPPSAGVALVDDPVLPAPAGGGEGWQGERSAPPRGAGTKLEPPSRAPRRSRTRSTGSPASQIALNL